MTPDNIYPSPTEGSLAFLRAYTCTVLLVVTRVDLVIGMGCQLVSVGSRNVRHDASVGGGLVG